MFWFVSFPSSGNTFFQNILKNVYDIDSIEYHGGTFSTGAYYYDQMGQPTQVRGKEEKSIFYILKTYLIKNKLSILDESHKVVLLVREGRDCIIANSNSNKTIAYNNFNIREDIQEFIVAENDSYFGSWSQNVESWLNRADIIIRYEDLVKDPKGQVGRLQKIIDFPVNKSKTIPEFDQVQAGGDSLHNGKRMSKDEQILFWNIHGDTMRRLGYTLNREILSPCPLLEKDLIEKLNIDSNYQRNYRVLIEANKLLEKGNDGIKRYQTELLSQFSKMNFSNTIWEIDLLFGDKIVPLEKYFIKEKKNIIDDSKESNSIEIANDDKDEESDTEFSLGVYFLEKKLWLKNKLLRNNQRLEKSILIKIIKFSVHFILVPILKLNDYLFQKKIDYSKYDMVHIPLPQNLRRFKKLKIPLVVTIHDLTHITHKEFHTSTNLKNVNLGFSIIEKNPNIALLSVSDNTTSDIKRFIKNEKKVFKVSEAANGIRFNLKVNQDDLSNTKDKYGIKAKKYVFTLCTIEPRKNILNTIRAFIAYIDQYNDLDTKMVIAGKFGWGESNYSKIEKEVSKMPSKFIFTGFVDDEDLPILLNGARAMCYISLYEGFGLPILEAYKCGLPVICGRNSSQIEVAGPSGILVDPLNINEIVVALDRIINDDDYYLKSRKECLKHVEQYSWYKAASETLACYKNIIEMQ